MQIKTSMLIVNPCDDEYDDMALLCCHDKNGELFSLSRFPDENEVEITLGDDHTHLVSSLKVTFSAERLLIEIDPADGETLKGQHAFEILHTTAPDELIDVEETLQILLENVGTYVSQLA
jgi:hypothetical protein